MFQVLCMCPLYYIMLLCLCEFHHSNYLTLPIHCLEDLAEFYKTLCRWTAIFVVIFSTTLTVLLKLLGHNILTLCTIPLRRVLRKLSTDYQTISSCIPLRHSASCDSVNQTYTLGCMFTSCLCLSRQAHRFRHLLRISQYKFQKLQ